MVDRHIIRPTAGRMRPNTSESGIFSTNRSSAVSVSMLTRMLVPKPKKAFQSPGTQSLGWNVDVAEAITPSFDLPRAQCPCQIKCKARAKCRRGVGAGAGKLEKTLLIPRVAAPTREDTAGIRGLGGPRADGSALTGLQTN